MGNADVTIGARITADASQATESVKSFKQQLKEAQEEVVILSEKFGETSKQAQDAAKRAAELGDKIGDAKKLVDAFNPDQKFRAFSQSLQGVFAGFTALTGAMGLLGVESEETQKALLKVQSALALSQGLNQLGEAINSFKQLGSIIITRVVTAFQTLRGAIAATGIGLLITGIATAIAYFERLASAADKATEAQNKALRANADQAKTNLQIAEAFFKRREDLEIAQAKKRGASEKEIFEIQQRNDESRLLQLKKYFRSVIEGSQEELQTKQRIADLTNKIEVDRINFQNEQRRKAAENAKKDAKDKRPSSLRDPLELTIQPVKDFSDNYIDETLRRQKADEDAANKRAELFSRERDLSKNLFTEYQAQQQEKIRLAEAEAAARIQNAQDIGIALGALSDLIGQQTAAGKVLAIAQATINTWLGVTEILRTKSVLPEPAATISRIANVAVVIASGLNAVKNIIKTQVAGAGGGSGGATSAPAAQLPLATQTQLNQGQLNQIGNAASRVFVLEADVSNSQERIRRLNRAARL